MNVCLVSLVCASGLQDAVVDCLMAQEDVQGFSSFEINSYSPQHAAMSLLEQVSGRQKKLRFEVHLQQEAAQRLLALLKTRFGGSHIQYMLYASVEVGEL